MKTRLRQYQKKKAVSLYPLWIWMQNSLAKYYQIEWNNKENYKPWPNGVYSKNASLVQYLKISNGINYINGLKKKKKNHMIISVNTEKAFDTI